MHFNRSGSGNTILLIHGFCETSEVWSEVEKELSLNYDVISIDLPGCGKSQTVEIPSSMEILADQINGFLDRQNIAKCFVIGHSLGGYVTLALARLYPQKLTGFGLFHSTTFADSEEKKHTRLKGIEHVKTHGIEKFAQGFVPNLFYSENHVRLKSDIIYLRKMASKTLLKTFTAYSLAMKDRRDSNDIFDAFKKPIFIIAGEQDNAVPLSPSQAMISKIKNGDTIVLPNTGHLGFIESKRESLLFIKSFFNRFSI
ncbi:MAG: alpha/beta hydrolase [Cyclobacteriaceae bacterium]